jgi:hypothetical protein
MLLSEQLKLQANDINELKDDMKAMKKKNMEIEEASLISDVLFHLYRLFITVNKDDDDVKRFIDEKKNLLNNQTYHEINVKAFHDIMKQENLDAFSANIKSKFNESINKKSKEKLFSYACNSDIYSRIVEPRNNACYRSIKVPSKYSSNKEFLLLIQEKIQKMSLFKVDAENVFKQLQSLIDVSIELNKYSPMNI